MFGFTAHSLPSLPFNLGDIYTMKPFTSSLALACLALVGGSEFVHAQSAPAPAPAKQVSFGVSGLIGLPIGDFGKSGVDGVLGLLVSVDYDVLPQIELTGRAGYLHWLVEGDGVNAYQIPVWVGARYFLQPGKQGAFIHGESGFNSLHVSLDVGGGTVSDSNTEMALNLLGGFRQGNLVVEGGLYIGSLDDSGESQMIGGTLGTSF